MKKDELFEIYEEWKEKQESRMYRFYGPICTPAMAKFRSNYEVAIESLKEATTPLQFFRRLSLDLLDDFADVFIAQAIGNMRWENEEDKSNYYSRSIQGIPIETWDITKAWDLGRNEAQALQYILRSQYKGQEKEDLKKAIRFLQRALEEMEDTNS